MTQEQISEKVQSLRTKIDLLNLLNHLKREDLGNDCHRFTLKQINFYCNPNHNPKKRYQNFYIPKKSGGMRKISSPRGALKSILTYLNVIFSALYEPTQAAMGFVPGRSIADNASMHIGKNYVFNTDIKDFFPSIHQARIWKILQLRPFYLTPDIASVIAGLCCMQDPNGILDKNGKKIGVLPQGSPCSPILTNIVCRNLDKRLLGLAKRFNIQYTRYADDITFSSDYNVFNEDSEFMKELIRIVSDQNFEINKKKTRLQKRGSRQEVTGLVVNEKVNIVKEYYNDLRSLLYIWQKYGKEQAYAKFYIRYISSKTYKSNKNYMPSMPAVINGKLLYLKMVIGDDSYKYITLRDKFLELCPECGFFSNTNLYYLVSYRLENFELLFNTNIEFAYKPKNGVIGKSKTMGSFIIGDEKHIVYINSRCDKSIDRYLVTLNETEKVALKKRLFITLSERGSDRFWLITAEKMNNEHPRSFKDTYKPKLRIKTDQPSDVVEEQVHSSKLLDVLKKSIITNDLSDYECNIEEELIDIDKCLSEFVNSGFDLKTLEKWDKTKMN